MGRCVLSRLIYGIRPTLGCAADYAGNHRFGRTLRHHGWIFPGRSRRSYHARSGCDAFLPQPDHGILPWSGCWSISVQNVIIANVFIKWAWYARMIRTGVIRYRDRNFVQFSRCVGMPERFILFSTCFPPLLQTWRCWPPLDVGWAIINISTLSFLGLGVRRLLPEWAMLNEAKEVLTNNPVQMIAPGVAIVKCWSVALI